MGRVIAIGDIHGCARAFDTLLRQIRPKQADTIITLGDYVDRGPESAQVLDIMNVLIADCKLIPLIGNHEIMMLNAARRSADQAMWLKYGGKETLDSYGGRMSNIPSDHWMFLKHCVRLYETETHFFIHANYLAQMPLAEIPDDFAFWQHTDVEIPGPHMSGKIGVVGHTPQSDGMVKHLGHLVQLDTYCFGGGWLSAMEINTGEVWQANQAGEFRKTESLPPSK